MLPDSALPLLLPAADLGWPASTKSWLAAQVYRAMLGSMTQVAVKVLHESDGDRSFAREIAILRSCRHSNIVQFLVRPAAL